MLNTPEATHTMRLAFTDPVYLSTPVGDTKIPLPIIEPTITVIPLSSDILASNAPPSLFSSCSASGLRTSGLHSSSDALFLGDL